MKKIKLGRYRHYKGNDYQILFECKHSETLEDLVCYKTLYKNKLSKFWVRPKAMFFDKIEIAGKKIPRFKYLGAK